MSILRLPHTTIEYILAPVTGAASDITAMVVQVGFMPAGTKPEDVVWESAAWDTDAPTTIRWLYDGTSMPGEYHLWSRITDLPEIPVRDHGTVVLT